MAEDIGTSLGVCFTLARDESWLREDIGGEVSGTAPCSKSLLDSRAGVGERLGALAATLSSFKSTRLTL